MMHWDFAIILLFFATAVPILGWRRIRQLMAMDATTKQQRLRLYWSTILFQWLAVAIVFWRVRAHGFSFRWLGIAMPKPALTVVVTILLAGLVLGNQLFSIRRLAAQPDQVRGALPRIGLKIFPQDNTERLVFALLSVTVACCEEVIFRGFAQGVFRAWFAGVVIFGVIASALLFSVAHLYQGPRGLIATFVVGVLFSLVRSWTGSLFAPAVAHFIADFSAGMLVPPRTLSDERAASRQTTLEG